MKKSDRKSQQQSEETRAVSLLTTDRVYSDPNTKKFRRTLITVITNRRLTGVALADAVTATVQGLGILTRSPLEIADLIRAWGIMFPDQVSLIFNGVRSASIERDRNAEGIALGLFELWGDSKKGVESDRALFHTLGYHLGGRYWDDLDCVCTSAVNGRLSTALADVVCGIWSPTLLSRNRLQNIEHLILKTMRTNMDGPTDIPRTLHDYLINEICAKVFLEASPFHRREIFDIGLAATIARLPELVLFSD